MEIPGQRLDWLRARRVRIWVLGRADGPALHGHTACRPTPAVPPYPSHLASSPSIPPWDRRVAIHFVCSGLNSVPIRALLCRSASRAVIGSSTTPPHLTSLRASVFGIWHLVLIYSSDLPPAGQVSGAH